MPKRPIATSVLALRGAFRNHPSRLKAREGEPDHVGSIGRPPKSMTAEQAAVWRELVACGDRGGVLARSDRLIVEATACLIANARACQWAIPASTAGRITSLLSELGMTPASNSRVKVVPRPGSKNDSLTEFALARFKRPSDRHE